jgi:hypothetical protein
VQRASASGRCNIKVLTYRNLKIHHLLRKSAHLIIEAEPILAHIIRRKHKVALSLLCAVEDDLVRGARDRVVYVEGAAGLDLFIHSYISIHF